MPKCLPACLALLRAPCLFAAEPLSVQWEELTAADFAAAIQQSQGVCVLPFGIIEKHGPHLPLGTILNLGQSSHPQISESIPFRQLALAAHRFLSS